jgi:hypothetical protein
MNIPELWGKLDGPSRQAIYRTALWITLIVGTVYTLGQSDLMQDLTPLAVKMDMPDKILIPKSNTNVNLPVSLQLKNNTQETALLEVSSPCNIIRWYITSIEGEFVQAPGAEPCSQVVMRANLPAGNISQDELIISLDAQRYIPGQRYRLMLRYWGQDSSHEFEIETE